jgi:hypothetical protein
MEIEGDSLTTLAKLVADAVQKQKGGSEESKLAQLISEIGANMVTKQELKSVLDQISTITNNMVTKSDFHETLSKVSTFYTSQTEENVRLYNRTCGNGRQYPYKTLCDMKSPPLATNATLKAHLSDKHWANVHNAYDFDSLTLEDLGEIESQFGVPMDQIPETYERRRAQVADKLGFVVP